MADDRGRVRGARGRAPAARRASTAPGRSRRPRQLTRARTRAETVVAATTELLGLSSTRRAAVLAAVLCALALTVSVPLRNYMAQRQELATVTAQQEALAARWTGLRRSGTGWPTLRRSRPGAVAPGRRRARCPTSCSSRRTVSHPPRIRRLTVCRGSSSCGARWKKARHRPPGCGEPGSASRRQWAGDRGGPGRRSRRPGHGRGAAGKASPCRARVAYRCPCSLPAVVQTAPRRTMAPRSPRCTT